jgi:hypothetical protein
LGELASSSITLLSPAEAIGAGHARRTERRRGRTTPRREELELVIVAMCLG